MISYHSRFADKLTCTRYRGRFCVSSMFECKLTINHYAKLTKQWKLFGVDRFPNSDCQFQSLFTLQFFHLSIEGDVLYFDYVASKQLLSDSIRDSFTVGDLDECAQRCTNEYLSPPCLAFQTIITTGNLFCHIAMEQYQTMPNTGSFNFFQIENMPCK